MKRQKIQVQIRTFQRKWSIDREAIRRFAGAAWTALEKQEGRSLPETEMAIVLLNNKRMQWYNHTFRKKNSPTDVLSFPVNETGPEGRHCLGDVLISLEKADEQARMKRHTLDRELQILLLHGILHLKGYDHERDTGEMNRLESRLRKKILTDTRLIRPAGKNLKKQ
jgi:probable rRNA maturation factor